MPSECIVGWDGTSTFPQHLFHLRDTRLYYTESLIGRVHSMILGLSTSTFTFIHVVISLVAIVSGLVVTFGMIAATRMDKLTALFLITTVATSLTGFAFPNEHLTPGIIVGIISMVVLIIAILARYAMKLAGAWRWIYVMTSVIALYLNVFVLIVQSFQKI